MLEIEHISVISDEVRAVVEEEWPELAAQAAAEGAALTFSPLMQRVRVARVVSQHSPSP
jgi:hypothetical protein